MRVDIEQIAQVEPSTLVEVFNAIPTPIIVAMDPLCQSVRMNAAFTALLGLPADFDAAQCEAGTLGRPYRYVRDGRELESFELPIWQAIIHRAPTGPIDLDLRFDEDGVTVRLAGNAAPIFDAGGEVVGSVAAFVDVTEYRGGRSVDRYDEPGIEAALSARLELLRDIDEELADAKTSAQVLDTVLAGIVPRFCDAAVILDVDSDGRPRVVRTYHRDAAAETLLDDTLRNFDYDTVRLTVSRDVARYERPYVINDLRALIETAPSEDYASLVRALVEKLNFAREVLVPMRSHGVTNGVVVAFSDSSRVFTGSDVQVLEDIGRRASILIERMPS